LFCHGYQDFKMIFTHKHIYKFVSIFHFDPTPFLGSFERVYYAHDCHLVDNSSFFICFVHMNNDSRFFGCKKKTPSFSGTSKEVGEEYGSK